VCHHPKSHLHLQAIVVIHSSIWFFLSIATCYSWPEINDEVIVNWKQSMCRNFLMDTETDYHGMEQNQLSNLCLLPTAIISKFTFSNQIVNWGYIFEECLVMQAWMALNSPFSTSWLGTWQFSCLSLLSSEIIVYATVSSSSLHFYTCDFLE
jgi:hypothetical protein